MFVYINVRPCGRTPTLRPDFIEIDPTALRLATLTGVGGILRQGHLHVPAAGEASGRSPLHDVKDARAGSARARNVALGKSGTRLARSARLYPRSRSAERGSAPDKVGGARRDRTDDLLLAKQALSQLSYGPAGGSASLIMVGLGRLELPTSRLSGVRSNHLSYRPDTKQPFSDENASSCLKKEKRRRRRPALVSRIRSDS